jgi:intracellular sulfur oxidation DsrE/DsrF family protein
MSRSRALPFVLVACLALGPGIAGAEAEAPDVYVVITSPDNQTQGMALVLTIQMVEQGQSARILLCDAAGELAVAAYDPPKLAPRDVSPKDMLMGLMQRGVPVEVCALFLPNSAHAEADLVEGVTAASPPAVAALMIQDGVRWFTF